MEYSVIHNYITFQEILNITLLFTPQPLVTRDIAVVLMGEYGGVVSRYCCQLQSSPHITPNHVKLITRQSRYNIEVMELF